MPELSEVSYSHDATISAVRDYYRFLVAMYLDDSSIIEPPDGGWPMINATSWADFNKTDEVISLLRHLPYIRPSLVGDPLNSAPNGRFADWTWFPSNWSGRDVRESTEIPAEDGDVPPHIVGLTTNLCEGNFCPRFLLDTELGVVYWPDCPGEIQYCVWPDQIGPDPHGMADEGLISYDQAQWRASGGVWAIADFFEN